MNVRFRAEYSDSNPYGLKQYEGFYNVKLLGLIPAYKMEITNDPTDIPAIEPFIKLANMQK